MTLRVLLSHFKGWARCRSRRSSRDLRGVRGMMHELNTPREEQILVTDVDLKRLLSLLDRHDDPLAESVEAELLRATIVAQRDVPADVVTMNSEVVYEDCATGAR